MTVRKRDDTSGLNLKAVLRGLPSHVPVTPQNCRRFNQAYFRLRSPNQYFEDGIDVPSWDWDNLIVLDACRVDLFNQVAPEKLLEHREVVQSRGTSTSEWLRGNFLNRTYGDIVYVTANPMFARRFGEIGPTFHAVDHVWQDGWDEHYKTVLPGVLAERATIAADQWPDKRLLVHFIQPHFPFLTETTWDKQFPDMEAEEPQFWHQIKKGNLRIPREEIWDAYRTTLEMTFPAVVRLVDTLPGKTVVMSDHGNLLGERTRPIPIRDWGHPPHLHVPELLNVPWVTLESDSRKTVVEGAVNDRDHTEDNLDDRLEALGYKT